MPYGCVFCVANAAPVNASYLMPRLHLAVLATRNETCRL